MHVQGKNYGQGLDDGQCGPERHLRLGERARGRLRIWDCGVRGLVHALRGRLRRAAHL